MSAARAIIAPDPTGVIHVSRPAGADAELIAACTELETLEIVDIGL